jgi:hypothetical protein
MPHKPGADRRRLGHARTCRRPLALLARLPPSGAGPTDLATLPDREKVYSESTSIFFKHTHVFRIVDRKHNTLVYVAISDKIIEGSPENALSTVPIVPWPAAR